MKKLHIAALCSSLVLGTQASFGSSTTPITVPDGGFETPSISEESVLYNATGSAWTFEYQSGLSAGPFNWFSGRIDHQSAFLQSTGRVYQVIDGFAPENTYTLTFAASQRQTGDNEVQAQTWDVELDGVVIKSFDPGAVKNWNDYSVVFTTTAGAHEIAFHATNLKGDENAVNLDNIRLTSYPTATPAGLRGEYFASNWKVKGQPAFTRLDPNVNFHWYTPAKPDPSFGNDYSIRWSGKVQPLYSETYNFYVNSDNGTRLWVNGSLLVDGWGYDETVNMWDSIDLVAGEKYDIVMEYANNGGSARAELYWESTSQLKEIIPTAQLFAAPETPKTGGLKGEYRGFGQFGDGENPTAPIISRVDPEVNFLWNSAYPVDPAIQGSFAVKWFGKVQPLHSETYTFSVEAQNFFSLSVNGTQLFSQWAEDGLVERSGTVTLEANQKYDIEVRYQTTSANGEAKLMWESASTPKQVIPSPQLFPPVPTMPTTPIQLTPIGRADGTFSLLLQSDVGFDYVLQFSTDLVNWTDLSTNTAVSMPMTLIDTQATDAQRFYRVVVK